MNTLSLHRPANDPECPGKVPGPEMISSPRKEWLEIFGQSSWPGTDPLAKTYGMKWNLDVYREWVECFIFSVTMVHQCFPNWTQNDPLAIKELTVYKLHLISWT